MIKKQEKEDNSKLNIQSHINNAVIPSESINKNEAHILKPLENELNQENTNIVKTEEIPKKITLNYNEITNETKTWSVLTK